jgi:NAD(P)-dependent dehydrogenase (short-subunit alcohol dehydrogenase family)
MFRILVVIGAALLGLCSIGQAVAADTASVLITGANRGIGLEYARQFAAKGYRVIGTARDVSAVDELTATGAQVEALDVTDAASVAALAKRLDGVAIDILVNNAGMFDRGDSTLDKVDFAMLEQTFAVNTFGPLRVTQALLPNLRLGQRKQIVNMSSHLGSIAHSTGGWYAYRSSKTALNQINKILSVELGKEGFTAVVLHPGWVRTELGGMNATYGPEESVRGLIGVIEGLTTTDNGRFYDFQGKPIDW